MRQIINYYAIEKKDGFGKPSGQFFVNKPGAYLAARIVIKRFMPGANVDELFAERVPTAWAEEDVNKEGRIEAERIPMFLRKVINNAEIGIHL